MGPNQNALEEVKRDAIKTTLRHFRDDMLDNEFEPANDLDEVQAQLLAERDASKTQEVPAEAETPKRGRKKAETSAEEPASEGDNSENVPEEGGQ